MKLILDVKTGIVSAHFIVGMVKEQSYVSPEPLTSTTWEDFIESNFQDGYKTI